MADNTKNKESKNNKQKKSFFKDVRAELKKVTWPTTKQVVNNTIGVIVIVIITAIIVFILDFTFNNFNEYVVNGIRTQISEMQNTTNDESTVNENVVDEEGDTTLENEVSENETSTTENTDTENNEVVENTASRETAE